MGVRSIVAHVAAAGPACREFAQGLQAERGALALRAPFGLCDLLERHGRERVEVLVYSPSPRAHCAYHFCAKLSALNVDLS